MKKYRIVKNFENWLGCEMPNSDNIIIDEDELKRLSGEWEKPVDDLMGDLEEMGNKNDNDQGNAGTGKGIEANQQ